MKAPGAAIQGGLAALGLIAAYTTWQREPDRKAGEVVVIDASANDIQKIRFEDKSGKDTKWIELTRKKETDGPHVWLHLAAKAETKTPEREVRGNESAQKLWDKFAPLKGSRALGVLPEDKLKQVNLDAPKKRIEVTVRGSQRALLVGISPFGVSDPYVQDESDKKVYVLGGGVVSDLDSAALRLVDRQLHDWKATDVESLKITTHSATGDKSRELNLVAGETPNKVTWVDRSGKTDEHAKQWHDKLSRALVTEVLGKGETPLHGDPKVVLRIDYKLKGHEKSFIEFARIDALPADTSTPPGKPAPLVEDYARTDSTAGWVKLSVAVEDSFKDADKVVSGD